MPSREVISITLLDLKEKKMALIRCRECGKPVSTEAISCPHCGARRRTKKKRGGCGLLVLLFLVIAIVSAIVNSGSRPASNTPLRTHSAIRSPQKEARQEEARPTPVPAAQGDIRYEVVDKWGIPNGGFGQVIAIDPKYRNEEDLRKLAECLKKNTNKDRNAFVFIYDDKLAASLRKAAVDENLEKKELAHHDSHMIGSYMRNANTGYHALTITLKGVTGEAKERR